MGFADIERKVGYACLLGAAGCLGAWLADGSTAFATTGVILLVVAATSWIAARVWETPRR